MTKRDREIYFFIDMVGLCTAQQIKELFIPNVDITKTYQRLRVLIQEGLIKAHQIGLNKYYYTKKKTSKKMIEHDLKTTELISFLRQQGAEIIHFDRNKPIGRTLQDNIFADGYIIYKVKIGEKYYKRHILVEVQRTIQYTPNPNYGNLYNCIEKYNHTSIKKGLQTLNDTYDFKLPPPLVVITDIEDSTSDTFYTKMMKLPYDIDKQWNKLVQ